MIWVVFALMTGAAVFSVLWPLARTRPVVLREESDRDFYRAQLAGIDRDVSSGLMSAGDAEIAKAEAGRRLLTASAMEPVTQTRSAARRTSALIALILIPVISVGIYLSIGSPGIPDEPLQARLNATPERMDIGAAVAKIEKHLREEPGDGRGWALLAPVYLRLGRPLDAAEAYAKANAILGPTAERETARGEALAYAASGQVSPEAVAAFESALRLDKDSVSARYYLGLAAQQSGDKEKAVEIWSTMLASAPAGAPWVPAVKSRLQALQGGVPETTAVPSGPAAAAIANMAPQDRDATIRSMVEGLASRLAEKGGTADEWMRLVRAYAVLKDSDKARTALAEARKYLGQDEAARVRLDQLARELGLEG
jgi:cytochrome c-type biogenesis protein CcmH